MPLTHKNWLHAREHYEKLYLGDCDLLGSIGGNRERCSTMDGDVNVYTVWITQTMLLFLVLPIFCYRAAVHRGNPKSPALHKLRQSHAQCCSDAYATERLLIPSTMLAYLVYAFVSNLADDRFTLFFFTFLTVSTQLICNTVLCLRSQLELLGLFKCSDLTTAIRLYSQIILVHTFACTAFIVLALLVFAFTNQKLMHTFFIYKLMSGSPTIIANELIHTVPVLVYLFLIKTHHAQDLEQTKAFLASYVGNCVGNWFNFIFCLQIPSLVYMILVDWNCVYGRLAKPFKNDEVASAVAYIFISLISFSALHSYLFRRVLCGPRCEDI